MKKDILFISLYPADKDGGGERYFFNMALSAYKNGFNAHIACVKNTTTGWPKLQIRLDQEFLLVSSSDTFLETYRSTMKSILDSLHLYDDICVGQYLGSPLIFDIMGNVASNQHLYLTNLGFEPFSSDFWTLYQPSPNHHFVEISEYALSRIPIKIISGKPISAGLWGHEIGPINSVPRNSRQFCAVGRILPHKGFETAIKGLPDDASLVIIGDTSHDINYYNYLKGLARDKAVTFTGQIDNETRNKTIRESAGLIAASTHNLYNGTSIPQPELLGLVLLEAVSNGCLPIASNIPSFSEIMQKLKLQDFLFKEGDATETKYIMEKVFSLSKPNRQKVIETAQGEIKKHYLWDNHWPRVQVSQDS